MIACQHLGYKFWDTDIWIQTLDYIFQHTDVGMLGTSFEMELLRYISLPQSLTFSFYKGAKGHVCDFVHQYLIKFIIKQSLDSY